jgi:hypothetical protein
MYSYLKLIAWPNLVVCNVKEDSKTNLLKLS